MREIPLTFGKVALVDDVDYERISEHRWHYQSKRGYAARSTKPNGKRVTVLMHREIIGEKEGYETDHINRNRLDNQRANLRYCTFAQNRQNARGRNGSSRYKGVCWHSRYDKWYAQIKHRCIGYFDNEENAARAYDAAAQRLFGEFAKLNFPREEVVA